jgi:hypothetical protein
MNAMRHTLNRLNSVLWRTLRPSGKASPAVVADLAVPVPLAANVIRLSDLAAPNREKYTVFFAPEAGVVPHYITHCVVAKTLEDRGHRTLIVRCFDVYPRCIVMDGEVLPLDLTAEQRRDVCSRCRQHADTMTNSYGLNVIDLPELIDDDIRNKVAALTADLPDDISSFEIDGIRLGRLCGAQAAVTFKTTDFTGATPDVRRLLIKYLRGSLLSYFAMQRLLQTGSVGRVVHFNEYGMVLAAALAARKVGTPTTFMSMPSIRGVDPQGVVFLSEPLAIVSFRNRLKDWAEWRNLCLPPPVMQEMVEDALFRMVGNSVMIYSPTRSGATDGVFNRLKLSADRNLLVAFTSSLDEVAANAQYLSALNFDSFSDIQPFTDQIEWLTALIDNVEKSLDLQLVVRVHPREGANRRENIVSEHLGQLRSHFDRPFSNVRFVWPGDDISSYDLMELADVGLSGWSSTALEMARLGVPTVLAFDTHTPTPIGDVVQWARDPDKYFEVINQQLQRLPSLDQIRFGFRWTYLRTLGSSFDLGDVIPKTNSGVPEFRPPAAGNDIESVLIGGRTAIEVNHDRIVSAQGETAESAERHALLRELRRAVWQMCTGATAPKDYRLCYREGAASELPQGCDAMVSCDGGFIEFRTSDRMIRRRSKMVQRLALLAANELGDNGA